MLSRVDTHFALSLLVTLCCAVFKWRDSFRPTPSQISTPSCVRLDLAKVL